MSKKNILYLMRHLAARDDILIGNSVFVVGASEGTIAIVGNGVHPDGEAHLQAFEYGKAEEIGKNLLVPENIESMLICPSPLPRADETARHIFLGMAINYARDVLGLKDFTTPEAKAMLSERGLHKLAKYEFCEGLVETTYKDSYGNSDGGNELVAQAYCKEVNPNFSGYKWMVQKGFEGDPRSEHPLNLTDRALKELVPKIIKYDLILGVSHQPNIEIITAALTGGLGNDVNELWEIAGGSYAMGGGFRLSTTYNPESGLFESANLVRTPENKGTNFEKEITVDIKTLNKYLL